MKTYTIFWRKWAKKSYLLEKEYVVIPNTNFNAIYNKQPTYNVGDGPRRELLYRQETIYYLHSPLNDG